MIPLNQKSGDHIFLVVEGFAARFRALPDNHRQITSLMLPGDICDTRTFYLVCTDHSIAAVSNLKTVPLTADAVRHLESRPTLAEALARDSLLHQAITREWQLNVGSRTAYERLGHLMCELFERLRVAGRVFAHNSCELPVTQNDLAEMLGLSAVHVNRTLMELRRSRLLDFRSKSLVVPDYSKLCRVVGFDPSYLSLSASNAPVLPDPAEPERTAILHPQ